jgi:hypothetical protein
MTSRRIFEFRCREGHTSERLTYPEAQEILCPICSEAAQRVISPVRCSLDGISGAFPTASDKWARMHEQASRVANKRVEGRSQYED